MPKFKVKLHINLHEYGENEEEHVVDACTKEEAGREAIRRSRLGGGCQADQLAIETVKSTEELPS